MAAPVVTKIVLKNTTKMSLNERFTAYREQAASTSNFRNKIQMQRQATPANLRLAQQMANRPTVMAALRLKKRSLQQRLGQQRQQSASNVKARLNLGARRVNNAPNIQGRLGNFHNRGGGRFARAPGRGAFKPGTSPLLKSRLGAPARPQFNNQRRPIQQGNFRNRRGNFQVGNRQQNRGGNPGGSGLPASRNARGGGRSNRGGVTNRGGGGGNSRAGGRGRGGRWGGGAATNKAQPCKEELDTELDSYMAQIKSPLDSILYD